MLLEIVSNIDIPVQTVRIVVPGFDHSCVHVDCMENFRITSTIAGGFACAVVAVAKCYIISEYGCNVGALYACEHLGCC